MSLPLESSAGHAVAIRDGSAREGFSPPQNIFLPLRNHNRRCPLHNHTPSRLPRAISNSSLDPTISILSNRVSFRIPLTIIYNYLTSALGCHPVTPSLPSLHTIPCTLAQQQPRCQVLALTPAACATAVGYFSMMNKSVSTRIPL